MVLQKHCLPSNHQMEEAQPRAQALRWLRPPCPALNKYSPFRGTKSWQHPSQFPLKLK